MSDTNRREQITPADQVPTAPSPVPNLFPLKRGEQGTVENRLTDLFPGTGGNNREQVRRDTEAALIMAKFFDPERLVRTARQQGVRLRRDGERLTIQASDEFRHLVYTLLRNKDEILAHLDSEPPPTTSGRWLVTGAYWEVRDGVRHEWLPQRPTL